MAAATSVHVVAVIEPIIQHADWFFPGGEYPAASEVARDVPRDPPGPWRPPRPGWPARGASQEKLRAAGSRRHLSFLFHVKP